MLLTANTICLLSSMQHVIQAELAAWLATKLFKLFWYTNTVILYAQFG